jgi:hypothetical protein
VSNWIHTCRLLLLSLAVASITGCLIHYQYDAKIIEIRARKADDKTRIWSAIDSVVSLMDYDLSSHSGTAGETRSYFRPLRYFSRPSSIKVAFDETSNMFRITKIRVGSTKGTSSWDIDSHVEDLRDKLAAALPGLSVTIVTIKAEGQADLFPLGDYCRFRIPALNAASKMDGLN